MFKAIGKSFKKLLKSIWQWIKKHWKEILIAILIIVAVVLCAVYVLPAIKGFLSAKILAFDAWFGSKFGLASGSFGLSKLFGIGSVAAGAAKIGASAGPTMVGSSGIISKIGAGVVGLIKNVGGVIGENKGIIGGIGLAGFFAKNKQIVIIVLLLFIGFKLLERRRS